MSLDHFCRLPTSSQLFWVFKFGTHLLGVQDATGIFDLYVLADRGESFFIEVESVLEEGHKRALACRSFGKAEMPARWA